MDNIVVRVGLVAAAVVVIAVIAINLLPGAGPTPGGAPTVSPSVEPTQPAEQTPEPSGQAGVEPGPHVIWEDAPGVGSITLTLPSGWEVFADAHYLIDLDYDDVGILAYAGDLWVYEDPCQWSTTLPATPATTVDEVIDALGNQATRNASDPVDIGFENGEAQRFVGQSITLRVPDDAVLSDCDEGTFGTLTEPETAYDPQGTTDPIDNPTLTAQGPGQTDEFLVVDVDGVPVTFNLKYWDDTPADAIEEMRAIVESAVYGN